MFLPKELKAIRKEIAELRERVDLLEEVKESAKPKRKIGKSRNKS